MQNNNFYLELTRKINIKILIIILLIFLGLFCFVKISRAASYYVDGSCGSSGNGTTAICGASGPWKTLAEANTAVTSGTHTINVAAGTYPEGLSESHSGIDSNNFLYWKATGTVTITGGLVSLNGNYIKFDGFIVSGLDGTPGWYGAVSVQGTGTVVTNCTVHDVTYIGISTGGSSNGSTISNCTIYDNIMAGLFANGTNNSYLNNDISHQKYLKAGHSLTDSNGIVFSGTGHVFRGNYIHDIYLSEATGSHWDAFQTSGGNTGNIIIEKNRVFCGNPTTNTLEAVVDANTVIHSFMIEGISASWMDGLVIRNNIFECLGGYGTGGDGYVRNVEIYNNIFRSTLSASSGPYQWPFGIGFNNTTNAKVYNNVIVNFKYLPLYVNSNCTNVDMNYNLLWMSDGSTPAGGWRSGTGTSGAHDLANNTNPLFAQFNNSGIGPNDFHLQSSSPVINSGATISSVTSDYDGISRPQGSAYDIGAYEYVGTPSSDTQPPTIPANIIATAISSSQINLSWTASTDNVGVTGYRIYRGGSQIATSATNSYSDTGLTPSTAYSYTVAAYDAAGNVSSQSSSASATTQAAPPLTGGLVAAYSFNEGSGTTASDSSGNSNTGTLINSPTWTTSGKYGSALSFDGVNDYVDAGGNNSLDISNNLTISAWIKTSDTSGNGRIIQRRALGATKGYEFSVGTNGSLGFFYGDGTNYGYSDAWGVNNKINDGSWHHVVLTIVNGSTPSGSAISYVDGIFFAQQNFSTVGSFTQTTNLIIGNYSTKYFKGSIDEIRIYNRALSQSEIQTDMNTPLGGTDTTPPAAPSGVMVS